MGMLLNGGRIVGLALTLDSRVRVAFVITGAFLERAFGILIIMAYRKVNGLITKLEEGS